MKALDARVLHHLTMASKYEKGGGDKGTREKYILESKSLFNILVCRCKVLKCTQFHCEKTGTIPAPKCGVKSLHYDCNCGPDKTIPGHLLEFIW